MISRQLHEVSPDELLGECLKPTSDIKKLSPADRVFGWVGQNVKGRSAYRGQIRLGVVKCEREDAIEPFTQSVPLQILGQPKPQQGRFYVAERHSGEAQTKKRNNENAGYKEERGLRGRKIYPHHKLPDGYWDNPNQQWEKPLLEKYFQEFRRPNGNDQRDKQNRSVKGWVKPETVFEFDIHFINLSEVELGALLWLLQLEPDHFHRFGGGKPLGFGSVRLSMNGTEICKGENMKKRYESLDEVELRQEDAQSCVNKFKEAIEEVYDKPFDQVLFIKAFLKAASGFDKPIHYPRTTEAPNPEGESFEWFVINNKIEKGSVKYGFVLPNLSEDEGLPILKKA
jgi:CRISPR-associated protein (TIGR03986 family)